LLVLISIELSHLIEGVILPRNKNFRCGDLAEGYVLEAFRKYCFVAPVPREEDVGIDAYLTLHNERLIPLETFSLQVKSRTTRSFTLDTDSITYLVEQGIPYFIGRGDKERQYIEIFCADSILLWHVLLKREAPITLWLENKPINKSSLPQVPCEKIKNGTIQGYEIGPPILVIDAHSSNSVQEVMERWIEFCKLNRSSFQLGEIQIPRYWETNVLPIDFRAIRMSYGSLQKPALDRLHHSSTTIRWLWSIARENPKLIPALSLLTEWMRTQGVDPDPRNYLSYFASLPLPNPLLDVEGD
jgi:hypothetical protein